MPDLPAWSEWLGAIAAGLIALGVIWRKGLRPGARLIRAFVHAVDGVKEYGPTVLKIAEEFKPNGGGSLRDVIDRVETKADSMETNFAGLARTVRSHITEDRAAFARIEARLDEDWQIVKPTPSA